MEHETKHQYSPLEPLALFTLITMLATTLGAVGTYVKIAGATTTVNEKKIYSYK
jgi:hypothetical protein